MAHAVVRTDKMFGTDNRTGLVTVKYYTGSGSGRSGFALDNGEVVKIEGLATGEREVYDATTPSVDTPIESIVLIATPEMTYCPCNYPITEFENKADALARGYFLTPHSIFSVTKEALIGLGTPAVGNVVELSNTTQLNVVATATSGRTQIGKIIAVETVGKLTFYVIEVN